MQLIGIREEEEEEEERRSLVVGTSSINEQDTWNHR
jgi:hypothetical protein